MLVTIIGNIGCADAIAGWKESSPRGICYLANHGVVAACGEITVLRMECADGKESAVVQRNMQHGGRCFIAATIQPTNNGIDTAEGEFPFASVGTSSRISLLTWG
jgi:hypothetical protein